MNQAFTAILQKLVAEQGKEALLNPTKCKSFLADYTRSEYAKERRLFLQALEAGSLKAVNSAADISLCKRQQVKVLCEEYFMAEEAAGDLVDTLALILRGDTSKTKAQEAAKRTATESSAQPSSQSQNAPAQNSFVPTEKSGFSKASKVLGTICGIILGACLLIQIVSGGGLDPNLSFNAVWGSVAVWVIFYFAGKHVMKNKCKNCKYFSSTDNNCTRMNKPVNEAIQFDCGYR